MSLSISSSHDSLLWETPGCSLTHRDIKTLWLVFPVDSQEINRDTRHHDGQTNTADHRLRVEGEGQQSGPEEQVDHWPDQAHLSIKTFKIVLTSQNPIDCIEQKYMQTSQKKNC